MGSLGRRPMAVAACKYPASKALSPLPPACSLPGCPDGLAPSAPPAFRASPLQYAACLLSYLTSPCLQRCLWPSRQTLLFCCSLKFITLTIYASAVGIRTRHCGHAHLWCQRRCQRGCPRGLGPGRRHSHRSLPGGLRPRRSGTPAQTRRAARSPPQPAARPFFNRLPKHYATMMHAWARKAH